MFPIFCKFCCKPLIIHAVYTVSSCSFLDSGPSYDIVDLADVANVFVANILFPEYCQ